LSTRRAAEYLLRVQRRDGDWDEQHYTGTGFPLDFMIRYHLYRLTFPLLALGRLRERLTG
jgi:squalene-hopene/tetraprenyl-beta-curcumene cyclase